jgi:hypothetical protein
LVWDKWCSKELKETEVIELIEGASMRDNVFMSSSNLHNYAVQYKVRGGEETGYKCMVLIIFSFRNNYTDVLFMTVSSNICL